MNAEIEIKFYPVDKDEMRIRFANTGFKLASPEFLMTRAVFDLGGKVNAWGRVRREHDKTTMSIKRVNSDTIDGVEEVQLVINSFEDGVEFMKAAGFRQKSFQENYRETWTRDGVEATIDTWPGLEPLVEIEGPGVAAVERAAIDLGFDMKDALAGALDVIYEKFFGVPRDVVNAWPEITFENPLKIA